jgi:hypothetical protein
MRSVSTPDTKCYALPESDRRGSGFLTSRRSKRSKERIAAAKGATITHRSQGDESIVGLSRSASTSSAASTRRQLSSRTLRPGEFASLGLRARPPPARTASETLFGIPDSNGRSSEVVISLLDREEILRERESVCVCVACVRCVCVKWV